MDDVTTVDAVPLAVDGVVPDSFGLNLYRADPVLARLASLYLPAELDAHLAPHLDRLGGLAGGELDRLAGEADRNPPTLKHRTRRGEDRQTVDKHPSYRAMERLAFKDFGLAALSHRGGVLGWDAPMPAAAKYLLTYLFVQAEFGLLCPVSMTDSLTRTLRKFGAPWLIERYLPGLLSQDLDALHQGAMFMTEQGAGSDVGATGVRAAPRPDGRWALFGDKWFCSNPDAGLAMVLARPDGAPAGIKGVSLFLLPRLLEDGSANAYRIVRLKDKLGTRSMASGEIRLEGATAWLVGEAGAGFRQMADMVNNSRLSNGVRAAGLMRRAVTEALYVAQRREAFGQRLIEMPLMRRQLAKMLVWAEQARTMMLQTADALRRSDAGEAGAYPLLRILTPMLKFRACRDARRVTGDAMEVRGGCGYIEEWGDARLVRDAHLGSIWEGTSNVVALDVLRAATREDALTALRSHVTGLQVEAVLPGVGAAFERAAALVARAQAGDARLARQAASGLYHVTSAAAMAWEGRSIGDAGRIAMAGMVMRHRVLARDPLEAVDDGDDVFKSGNGLSPLCPAPRKRRAPAQQTAFQRAGQRPGAKNENQQQRDPGEDPGRIIGGAGLVDEQAEALRGAGELPGDHADHAVGDRHAHAEQHGRRGGGQVDVAGELRLGCAHDAGQVDQVPVHGANAGVDAVEHQEEHHRAGKRHLAPDGDAEPDDEQRRQRDLGDAVEGHQIGLEDRGGARRAAQRIAAEDAGGDAEAVAQDQLLQRDADVRLDLVRGEHLDQAGSDVGGFADVDRADQPARGGLPDGEQDEAGQQTERHGRHAGCSTSLRKDRQMAA